MKSYAKNRVDTCGRRDFLARVAAGTAGIAAGATAMPRASSALFGRKDSTVALVNTSDHREAAYQSLKPFKSEVEKAIGGRKVVIKVNAGLAAPEYAKNSTHADHIRGVLDFVREVYDGPIRLIEGTAGAACSAFIGYENYGYLPIEKEYENVKFEDANDLPYTLQFIRAAKHHPQAINIIDVFHDPDVYLISAARMKTHNAVVGTFSLKNVAMGSPVCHYNDRKLAKNAKNEKSKMHGGPGNSGGRELSFNLFMLALLGVRPDLAVIDGVEAIEGNGPWNGEIVEHHVGIASTDFVAADRLCTELMGIDPRMMKYIEWCEEAGMGTYDIDKVKIIGPDYRDLVINYKMHDRVEQQVEWIHENYEI
jgi:uncharacterized protein (DUF362 family)